MRTPIIYISIVLFIASCQQEHQHQETSTTEKYTCPMHPQVIQDKPGKCPVCGMDLVTTGSLASSADLMLTNSQMRLANITTQKVAMKPIGQTAVVSGRLAVDEGKRSVISSRASGRIEKLFVKETGRTVQKGQPLYELYSEPLLVIQQEYLLAREQFETLGKTETRYESFLKAAERKLELFGLTKKQISDLGQTKSPRPQLTFLAPSSGIVTSIEVSEGQYIAEGGLLFKLDDVSSLWLEAELYPGETELTRVGDKITARISGSESTTVEATVDFLSPEYTGNSQVIILRATLPNHGLKLKPGMQAQVIFTHSAHKAITVPVDAVIRDAKGTHVYVQTSQNTFQPRVVKTGVENFDQVEILKGLKENEIIAATGAYLLYSEIVLKLGRDPMAVK